MTKSAYLSRVYDLFTGYEKNMLQLKRQKYEKEHMIRFISLQAYVNHLYHQVSQQPQSKNVIRIC